MACFLAPVTEAIVVSIVKKSMEKQERQTAPEQNGSVGCGIGEKGGISFSRKLGWLTKLLWGGSFLLAIEHIWHGEVVFWPPFLTAMNNPADIGPMLHEIATVGVTMAILVTAVWCVMVLISNHLEHKANDTVHTAATVEG